MGKRPVDLTAVRRIEAKIDEVLAAYPELQEPNPERQQAFDEWNKETHTMAQKATGKARGRPKTKEYVTLMARVPAELADLVKRYAAQHGQIPVSELIREGLEWRVGDGDPRGNGLYLAEPMGINEKVYDSNTRNGVGVSVASGSADGLSDLLAQLQADNDRILQEVLQDGDKKLRELLQSLAQQDDKLETLLQELARPPVLASNDMQAPSVPPAPILPKVKSDKTEILARLQQMQATGLDSTQMAKVLQAEGVPTLKGIGQWHSGTVRKLLGAIKG